MTKRLGGDVYKRICSMENLRLAHENAKKDKGFYAEVKMVDSNPDYYLKQIQDMLVNHTYYICEEDYTREIIHDRAKDRELWKLKYYPHRIIQWAIMLQISDTLHCNLVDFTCASIPKRGIHYALKLVKKHLEDKEESKFCLKIDIHHFYQSINRAILKKLIRKKFKDKELLWLLDLIIDSCPEGLPMGSYLSQYLANFYLSYFDHWLAEELKIKKVVRYMDDIVIFYRDKETLFYWLDRIKTYLRDELDLELKSNYQVFPTFVRGLDFVGYRVFADHIILRKSTYRRMRKQMLAIQKKVADGSFMSYRDFCCINSYKGWLKWCDGHNLEEKYIKPLEPHAQRYYNTFIKRRNNAK